MIVSPALNWRVPARIEMEWRDHLLTMLFGTWLLVGLFVDGWAHTNLDSLETFFTPWHAVFYSGFGVTSAWIVLWIQRAGGVPRGYDQALFGLVGFAAGGAGDMLWHTIFGIEKDVEALQSPTHLVLFASLVLILASPFRAFWLASDSAPSFRGFLPALLSLTLVSALCVFFVMYATPFNQFDALAQRDTYIASFRDADIARNYRGLSIRAGLAGFYITTVVLLAPLLLVLRRWHPPFGTSTLLFSVVVTLVSALEGFQLAPLIVAAAMAGLVADVSIRWLQPTIKRPDAYRAFAALVPVALWSAYFATAALAWGTWWTVNLIGGIIVVSSLVGVGLTLLIAPPIVPEPPVVATKARSER